MYHWVRAKNLPFTLEDIKRMTNTCPCCNELKPRFYRNEGQLIKATLPFERLNLDFKGPLPSSSRNRFMLTIVDEFSRFPFAIPCSDMSASTIIKALSTVFSLFGTPSYIHSDRGASFMSQELKSYLTSLGVATSRTTAYNPQGNGQVERYNGVIWKTILLALKSRNNRTEQWEEVLPQALHSIRSLLCTATNATPHERMFNHPRRSYNGCSLPTWLIQPGPVLLKNHVRTSKYDPLIQEVELIEANPNYAHVKLPDGRETTVSLRHLAPKGVAELHEEDNREMDVSEDPDSTIKSPELDSSTSSSSSDNSAERMYVRPVRERKRPAYLDDYVS